MPYHEKIVILTGAGLSAESGLSTFRDAGGLWANHRIEDVATPEAFAANPGLVYDFYNKRRAQSADATPNAAHRALARLQQQHTGVTLVTQNVDDLLSKAGADPIHMHGKLASALCYRCENRWDFAGDMGAETPCPACGQTTVRPDIVWFGEMPYHMDDIAARLEDCDLFASIGTSGQVYPAAGFVQLATDFGAETIELNLEPTSHHFQSRRLGPATETVPAWVAELLDSVA
ncbi:NAD-dependent deacylase [Sagittula sp. SSi028]|uniref:NAD-dependent deacylase n=1 Tax=Sagittula sp. SSi028 TaxID=3400636 RepID=UPI003AF5F635